MSFSGKRLAILLWLAFLTLCGWFIATSRYSADMSAFLPRTPSKEQQVLVDQLSDGVVSRMILIGIEGGDEESRLQLSTSLASAMRKSPLFGAINNGEQVTAERDRELLLNYRYLLSPSVTAQRFTPEGLQAAVTGSIERLASPAGLMLKSLLPRDPTGELLELLDQLIPATQPETRDGLWVSQDGQRALLLAQTRAAGSDTDGQEQAINVLRSHFSAAQQQLGGKALQTQLLLSGPGVFSVSARQTIKSEVTRLSLISISIIVLLLLAIYRSFLALGIGLLPVVTGAVAGIAAVSLGFGTVHGITIGFGTTLIGEAVDYSIYLLIQSRRSDGTHAESWIASFWPTIQLGVLTSLIGFTALLFSDFPGLAQLGMYSIAGLIAAALVTRYVLVALIPKTLIIRDVSYLGTLLQTLLIRAASLRWLVALLVVISIVVLYLHRHTLWNSELTSLSPISAYERDLDMHLRADLGAPDTRYMIVITAPTLETVLQSAERVESQLRPLVAQGLLAGFESPTRYLPSMATQLARQAVLPPAAELQARLQQATTALPLRAARLTPFLEDVEQARQLQPLQLADLEGSSLGLAANSLLMQQTSQWRALLPLQSPVAEGVVQNIDPSPVRAAMAASGAENALFVDMKGESDKLYSGYMQEALTLSLCGVAAIFMLLLLRLRSLLLVLRIIAPLAVAILFVTAALALAGEQLIILHLIGMLLIIAVGSNYALFFHQSGDEGPSTHSATTLASLLVANLTTVSGFGLLAFSSVPVLHAIGITVGPGAILALILSAIMARSPQRKGH